MIKEHQRVVLAVDLPKFGLMMGDVGVVVHIYRGDKAYEVEFFTLDGQTLDVVTVEASQLRPIRKMEVMHARSFELTPA